MNSRVMKTMAFRVMSDLNLFVVVYGAAAPTDDEWYSYMAAVRREGIDSTLQLIVTDGGGPTSTQRKYLNVLLAGRVVPVAVMSNSVAVRAITTALSWFNRGIKSFSQLELPSALQHLRVSLSHADRVSQVIEQLRGELRHLHRVAS